MEIYVVTKGEYSDYHIVGCFKTRKKAEKIVEQLSQVRGTNASIETYNLDDVDFDNLALRPKWSAVINIDTGNLTEEDPLYDLVDPNERGVSSTYVCSNYAQGGTEKAISCSYISQKHANKLAVEARQKTLRLTAEMEKRFNIQDKVMLKNEAQGRNHGTICQICSKTLMIQLDDNRRLRCKPEEVTII